MGQYPGLGGRKGKKGIAPPNVPISVGVQPKNLRQFNSMVEYGSVKKVKPRY